MNPFDLIIALTQQANAALDEVELTIREEQSKVEPDDSIAYYDYDDDFPQPHLDDPRINDFPDEQPTDRGEVPF